MASLPAIAQSRTVKNNPKEPPKPQKQEKQFPLDASWVAISLNGKPYTDHRPTFTLDKQLRAKGFGGCNTFSVAAYPQTGQRFLVGPFAVTKRACDKDVMAAERTFLLTFHATQEWDLIEGGRLMMKGPKGELIFDRAL
jgi:heat shock protein HslJ